MNDDGCPRIYLDANIFIYVVEGHPTLRRPLEQLMEGIQTGTIQALTSELTLAEVLVKPLSQPERHYVTEYRLLLSGRPDLPVMPVTREVLEKSAELRASIGGKLADAIHVATAVIANCTHILTDDERIKVPPHLLPVKVVDIPSLLKIEPSQP